MRRVSVFAFALLAVTACTPRAVAAPEAAQADVSATSESAPNALLTGTWVSVDDAKFALTITPGGDYIETYDGADATTSKVTWVSACEDAPASDAGPYLLVTGDDLERCFALAGLDESSLDLTYIGRGNTLAFTRAQD